MQEPVKPDAPTASQVDQRDITFHFVKSNLFRVIHADGAIVSIGPKGLFFSLYSERAAIPQSQTFALKDNHLGEEQADKRVVRQGIVREVEVGVSISLQDATSLIEVLQRQVDKAKTALAEANEPGSSD